MLMVVLNVQVGMLGDGNRGRCSLRLRLVLNFQWEGGCEGCYGIIQLMGRKVDWVVGGDVGVHWSRLLCKGIGLDIR